MIQKKFKDIEIGQKFKNRIHDYTVHEKISVDPGEIYNAVIMCEGIPMVHEEYGENETVFLMED